MKKKLKPVQALMILHNCRESIRALAEQGNKPAPERYGYGVALAIVEKAMENL